MSKPKPSSDKSSEKPKPKAKAVPAEKTKVKAAGTAPKPKAAPKAAPAPAQKPATAAPAAPEPKATAKKPVPVPAPAPTKAKKKKDEVVEVVEQPKVSKKDNKRRIDTPEIQEKIRELIKLAKEQEYLTYDDINEVLPNDLVDPDDVEAIMDRLRNMEFDIIDAS